MKILLYKILKLKAYALEIKLNFLKILYVFGYISSQKLEAICKKSTVNYMGILERYCEIYNIDTNKIAMEKGL